MGAAAARRDYHWQHLASVPHERILNERVLSMTNLALAFLVQPNMSCNCPCFPKIIPFPFGPDACSLLISFVGYLRVIYAGRANTPLALQL